MFAFRTFDDLGDEALARPRYGRIACSAGRFRAVQVRPWPKVATLGTVVQGALWHRYARGDRCWLYYNQPWGHESFLALKYFVSTHDCRLSTALAALAALDAIARAKGCQALVCDAANLRIRARHLARYGWVSHAPSRWHRNYIKRLASTAPAPRQLQCAREDLNLHDLAATSS